MSIRVIKQPNSTPPSAGLHRAVLTSVIDLGTVQPKNPAWKPRRQVELTFALDQYDSSGQPFVVRDRVTLSLWEKANLSMYVDALVGNVEIPVGAAVEVEDLIGRSCQLLIKHSKPNSNGHVWGNIADALPLAPGMQPLPLPAAQLAAATAQPAPVAAASLPGPAPVPAPAAAAPVFTLPSAPAAVASSFVIGQPTTRSSN